MLHYLVSKEKKFEKWHCNRLREGGLGFIERSLMEDSREKGVNACSNRSGTTTVSTIVRFVSVKIYLEYYSNYTMELGTISVCLQNYIILQTTIAITNYILDELKI